MQQARELLDPRAGIARLGLYLTIVAPDAAHLATYTDRAISTLTTHMSAEAGRGIGLQLPLWQSTLPLGVDAAGRRYRLRSETIGNAFPFLSHNPGSKHGYPLGFTRTGHQLVLFDPADPGHRNSLVTTFGSTGSGKTFMTLKMVLFTLLTGGRVTIVDRSAHYEPLRAVAGGVEVRFAGPQPPALNMWERSGAELATKINFVADAHEILLVNPGEQLSPLQRSAIEEGIRTVYERHADGSAPCEHELVDWLEGQAVAAAESEERQLYKNLAASLYPYVRSGRFAPIVDRPTSVDLDAPLVLFNIEGLSPTLHAFVMFAIAEVVDRRARRRAGPTLGGQVRELLVIDEGWFLIKYGRASAWIEEIARRGRHWGLFLMFVTQQLSDLLNDATATTLFNAASMTLIFRLRDEGGNAGGGSSVQRLCASLGLTREEALTVQRLETVRQEYAGLFLIRDTKEASVALRGEVQVIAHPLEYWLFTNDTQHGDLAKRERMVAACGGDVWRAVKLLAAGREPDDITPDDVHDAPPEDASTALRGAGPSVDAREERPAWVAR
jgi:type IV secretory pathway VirB4 component